MGKPLLAARYVNIPKTAIWQKTDNGKQAKIGFGFRDGLPRFQISTGVDGPDGLISFAANYTNMDLILNELSSLGNKENGYKFKQTYNMTLYEDNKPTDKKKLVSTLYVGKSNEGVCYITVVADKKPSVVFTFLNDGWNECFINNEPMSKEEYSKRAAASYGARCLKIMDQAIFEHARDQYDYITPDSGLIKQKDGTTSASPKADVVSSLADYGF